MKLEKAKFDRIMERYLKTKKSKPGNLEAELIKAIEFIEQNKDMRLINLIVLGTELEASFGLQKKEFECLCAFLEATLIPSADASLVTFDIQTAKAKENLLIVATNERPHSGAHNLGIKDKFIQGLSLYQHWLTDLDLEHMLKVTGIKPPIKIAPFDPTSLGQSLHFARVGFEKINEPYTLPFLLVCVGNDVGAQGSHWIAAKIKVNPINRTLSYEIEDSIAISDYEKAHYISLIEAAIKFTDNSNPLNPFSAFPDYRILESSKIHSSAVQADSYSCGYHALHYLLQDPSVDKEKNLAAKTYSEIEARNSDKLVETFQKILCEGLRISPAVYPVLGSSTSNALQKPTIPELTTVVVKPAAVHVEVNKVKQASTIPSVIVKDVHDCIGSYSSTLLRMRFPDSLANVKNIDSVQYVALLELLSAKIIKNSPLPDFELSHCDITALEGLDAFYLEQSPHLFEQLTLNILDIQDVDKFMKVLASSLRSLSKTNVATVVINDGKGVLTEAQIQELIKSVKADKVSISIELPKKYQTTAFQKELDSLAGTNRREKNNKVLTGQAEKAVGKTTEPIEEVVRTRKPIELADALKTDIELQEGVEETVVVEKTARKKVVANDYSEINILRNEQLEHAIVYKDIYPFKEVASGLSKEALAQYWYTIFGHIVWDKFVLNNSKDKVIGGQTLSKNKELNGVSESALERLIDYKEYFASGLNIRHLPQGFLLIADPNEPDKYVLHYDKNLDPQNTIAPRLIASQVRPIISIDMADKLIANDKASKFYTQLWQQMNRAKEYLREDSVLFRRYLPELMNLNDEQLKIVVELCGGVDHFNYRTLDFIFNNLVKARGSYLEQYNESHLVDITWLAQVFSQQALREKYILLAHQLEPKPVKSHPIFVLLDQDKLEKLSFELNAYNLTDIQLNGILNVYDKYGQAGITRILQAWSKIKEIKDISPELIKVTTAMITAHVRDYEALVLGDAKSLKSLSIINGFTKEQRQWWNKLYAAHIPVDDDLSNVLDAFVAFSKAVSDQGLQFYVLDPSATLFVGAGNLPTTLGRMLSILNLCNKEDKSAQWQVMSKINLSSTGALRALTDGLSNPLRPCGFVVPEMAIGKITEAPDPDKEFTYDSCQEGKSINTNDPSRRSENFYRYIAHQKYRMPLSFYQDAVTTINAASKAGSVPEDSVEDLYQLLAESTSGDNYRYFIDDIKKATEQWHAMLTRIMKIKVPVSSITAQLKRALIYNLSQLKSKPALPIMAKLIELSTLSLEKAGLNPFKLNNLKDRLEANNEKMKEFLDKYGSKMFLGMSFYSEKDYSKTYEKERDLFEEHLVIIQALQDADLAKDFMPLISTFKINTSDVEGINGVVKRVKEVPDGPHKKRYPHFNQVLFNYSLGLLGDFENNTNLSSKDLETFLNSLPVVFTQIREAYDLKYNYLIVEQGKLTEQIDALKGKRSTEYNDIFKKRESLRKEFALIMGLNEVLRGGSSSSNIKIDSLALVKEPLLALIEERFKTNFPKNYFENLRAGKVQGQIKLQLDKLFPDQRLKEMVEGIRAKFETASDDEQMNLLSSLESVCKGLTTADRDELLAKLKDTQLIEAPIQHYNQLLESIETHGHSSFVYFMQRAEQFNHPIENLVSKANYFLTKALPQIRNRKNPLVTEIDLVDLIADLVLAGTKDEMNKSYDVDPNIQTYTQFINVLKRNDVKEIQAELERTPNISNLDALQKLKAHLLWLNTKEYESVEVIEDIPKESEVEKPAVGLFSPLINFLNYIKKVIPPPRKTILKEKNKELDLKLLTEVSEILTARTSELHTYHNMLGKNLSVIGELIHKYPAAKLNILTFTHHFLSFKNHAGTQVEQSLVNLQLIRNEFFAINNQDIILSLCEFFGSEGKNGPKDEQFSYKDLLTIFEDKEYRQLLQEAKTQILKIVTSLKNNGKSCSLADIQSLINGCKDPLKGSAYVATLKELFQCAPFPTMDRIQDWFSQVDKGTAVSVEAQYVLWNKKPVAREEQLNGFKPTFARNQANLMQGTSYSNAELRALNIEVVSAKDLNTKDLLAEIRSIKNFKGDVPTKLVALMAELLYRTKGLPQEGIGADRKWGRSFEINTTQYLAIHAMLKSGGHVTSQIGTGEGKSWIMMIAIACQYALGKTVDFVTSDLSLATRDYLEFQPFFKAIGAETNLIYAQTPASEYRLGGINFSDSTNLSLFRNKARSEGNENLVIAAKPEQRALMLDEADKTYFDTSDTRFNYSAQADASIRDMAWIYELMVEFFNSPDKVGLYYSNAALCNQAFYDFASGRVSVAEMARLVPNPKLPMLVITRNQLEAWQSSALTAMKLKVGINFVIKPDVTIQTKEGPKVVSQALLVDREGRSSDHAKYSFGVHQCLHARLNLLKSGRITNPDKVLAQELAPIKSLFHLDSENQIVYSSTSKVLIDDYAEGSLLAVTGTVGSIVEQEEAAELFGTKGGPKMSFIDVPRHMGLRRVDFPVALARNETQQQKQILASIRESLGKNPPQPILLICENDIESKKLFDYLKEHLTPEEKNNLKWIHAKTPRGEEAEHVNKNAGKAGFITVSTPKLGRGIDIKLHKEKNSQNEEVTQGLKVVANYLPKVRDYWQIVGRAGRFGALGESRLILNKEKIAGQLKVEKLPTEFYTATENYLSHMQEEMDKEKQKQRIVKNIVGGFRMALTNRFFKNFYNPLSQNKKNKDNLWSAWQQFFDKTDKDWNEKWPKIVEELAKSPVDTAQINGFLKAYQDVVKAEWIAMKSTLKLQIESTGTKRIICDKGASFVDKVLDDEVGILDLGAKEKLLSQVKQPLEQRGLKTIVADKYDEAYVGRAVIYTNWRDGWRAFKNNFMAYTRGEGPLFPNLQAWYKGHLSFKQFFWGESAASKEKIPAANSEPMSNSSYKKMGKGALTQGGSETTKLPASGEKASEKTTKLKQNGTPKTVKSSEFEPRNDPLRFK